VWELSMKTLLTALISLIFIDSSANEIRETFHSLRALAMGNAFSAVVDDREALYVNPAALPKLKETSWAVVEPQFEMDADDSFDRIWSESDSTTTFADNVRDLYGRPLWIGSGFRSTYATPSFAIGAFERLQVSTLLYNRADPHLEYWSANDQGIQVGVPFPQLSTLHFGAALKWIERKGSETPIEIDLLGQLDAEAIVRATENVGSGMGLDLAALWAPAGFNSFQMTLVWHDVGQTTFGAEEGKPPPPPEINNLAWGLSWPISMGPLKATPTLEAKYLTMSNQHWGKRAHAGLELTWLGFSARVGANQGHFTYGGGVRLGFLRADYANYGLERGARPGQAEERRYGFLISLIASWDSVSGDSTPSSESSQSAEGE
jgi:hypothetical protein